MGLVKRGGPRTVSSTAGALELAHKLASKSSHVIGTLGKAAFYRQIELPLTEAYRYASEVMTENMMARDANEGIRAFIEKRDPTLGRSMTHRNFEALFLEQHRAPA